MNTIYPEIGARVGYVRSDSNGVVQTGTGEVRAIFVNEDKRVYVQVADGANVWNVSLAVLNPSPETIDLFTKIDAETKALTIEGNEAVRNIVAEYNAKIETLKSVVLGEVIEIEQAQPANQVEE